MGAERLLGNGDMLYLAPGTSHLTRSQGTYVGDDEINNIIEFYGDYEPQYSAELTSLKVKPAEGKGGIESNAQRDDMYEQAVEVVIREGRGSVSLLQRALGVGYGRGARLIDYMAEDGAIVGEYNGSQAARGALHLGAVARAQRGPPRRTRARGCRRGRRLAAEHSC